MPWLNAALKLIAGFKSALLMLSPVKNEIINKYRQVHLLLQTQA